jgi:hypothetical protein
MSDITTHAKSITSIAQYEANNKKSPMREGGNAAFEEHSPHSWSFYQSITHSPYGVSDRKMSDRKTGERNRKSRPLKRQIRPHN